MGAMGEKTISTKMLTISTKMLVVKGWVIKFVSIHSGQEKWKEIIYQGHS